MILPIQPCISDFKLPIYSSKGAAAFDIYSPDTFTLLKNETVLIPLGFAAAVPEGYQALLVTRSGTGTKKGLTLRNQVGIIDSDYRGEWMVKLALDNFKDLDETDEPILNIKKGDRIIQCTVIPVQQVDFVLTDSLSETVRGKGGLGSTGV